VPNQDRARQGEEGSKRALPGELPGRELAQYMNHARERRATYLFESNRLKPFSTRRIRQIIHQYAAEAGIESGSTHISFDTKLLYT
jgi:integrase/recombinase XerD